FTVQPNASIKLKLPAASGAAGRQLLYNWYRSTDGGYNFAFLASSITPELTINNTEEKGGVYYYICDVQYADESGENAILYKTLFEVTLIGRDGTVPTPPDEPVTPGGSGTATNVPKTGDETPLATLGTLLLLSLLGVGALLLYRRRSA
ncbi:MAG TPA: sortase B protein-sorting domain-containing protein, partial [Candidatus Limiplasma merdipullorum]|nr:sortase B protein-sorting domain-containing protein [Candidatus Limiplasma merdipullorum]